MDRSALLSLGRRWGDYATSRTPTVAAADCIGVVVVVVVEEEDEEGNWSPVAGGTRAAVSPGGLAMCAMCASVAAEGRPVDARAERRRGAGRRARPMIRATPLTVVAARARMQ